jgi:hypothetical protein
MRPHTEAKQKADKERRLVAVAGALGSAQPLTEVAKQLGVSYKTAKRDKAEIMRRLQDASGQAIEGFRAEQLIELSELKAQLLSPLIKADRKVELALAIIDREMKLLGTASPTTSITAHVKTEFSPLVQRFKKSILGLSDGQVEQVLEFAQGLTRERQLQTIDATWFPAPLLEESHD